MARPRVHDEALAEVLLAEATRIVGREGPDSLSLRRLTQLAGTSTSAIYSLYGSRDALLDAVYQGAMESFAEATAIEPTDDPLNDLLRMGVLYRQWARAHPHMYPVMFGRRSNDTTETIRERAQWTLNPVLKAVRRCMEAGQLREGDPQVLASQLWATAHGFVMLELDGLLEHTGPDDETQAACQEQFEALVRAVVVPWRP